MNSSKLFILLQDLSSAGVSLNLTWIYSSHFQTTLPTRNRWVATKIKILKMWQTHGFFYIYLSAPFNLTKVRMIQKINLLGLRFGDLQIHWYIGKVLGFQFSVIFSLFLRFNVLEFVMPSVRELIEDGWNSFHISCLSFPFFRNCMGFMMRFPPFVNG